NLPKQTRHGVNKLALTMCTLLSSQGPDALPTPLAEANIAREALAFVARGRTVADKISWSVTR
ncbi:hypothetical protein ACIQUC_17680, partial [Curtobacterium sp. NPDC098951]|uniref:hypothetical protein n=1 Tax=Curtobacterium sp. NPDC098951 TaxID=3363974 RepID=UPI00382112FC